MHARAASSTRDCTALIIRCLDTTGRRHNTGVGCCSPECCRGAGGRGAETGREPHTALGRPGPGGARLATLSRRVASSQYFACLEIHVCGTNAASAIVVCQVCVFRVVAPGLTLLKDSACKTSIPRAHHIPQWRRERGGEATADVKQVSRMVSHLRHMHPGRSFGSTSPLSLIPHPRSEH